MNLKFILACSDLGVHVSDSKKGPVKIYNNINKKLKKDIPYSIVQAKDDVIKSLDSSDKAKNLDAVNCFNLNLFNAVTECLKEDNFPFILGGDHSIAIGSALASINHYKNLGIIWIDSHGDYHNFDTTPSGNIHGLPFAAITGYPNTENLTRHLSSTLFNPKNAVLIGARDMEDEEIINLKNAGVTVFSTNDLKKQGIDNIINKAFEIASKNTNGVHISYDIDIIDPMIAMGVSVPAIDGIDKDEAMQILDNILKHNDIIKSFDLVEYNPDLDKDDITLNIANELIYKYIKGQD